MRKRVAVRRVHLSAGVVGFLTILTFWLSTVASELFGSHSTVDAVKNGVLWQMPILMPAMILIGGTGYALARKNNSTLVRAKKHRMPIIAFNGILILVPCAFFLASRAAAGQFDTMFYAIQAIELIAGGTNLVLMGRNMRDGLMLSGWIKRAALPSA